MDTGTIIINPNSDVSVSNSMIVTGKVAVYGRVSSSENKSNLETQVQRLLGFANAKGYQVDFIVKEFGSGLNDERPKLEKLLTNPDVKIIIVEHKDD